MWNGLATHKETDRRAGQDVKSWSPTHCWGDVKWVSQSRKKPGRSSKGYTQSFLMVQQLHSWVYPREMKMWVHTNTHECSWQCCPKSQKVETTQLSIKRWMDTSGGGASLPEYYVARTGMKCWCALPHAPPWGCMKEAGHRRPHRMTPQYVALSTWDVQHCWEIQGCFTGWWKCSKISDSDGCTTPVAALIVSAWQCVKYTPTTLVTTPCSASCSKQGCKERALRRENFL